MMDEEAAQEMGRSQAADSETEAGTMEVEPVGDDYQAMEEAPMEYERPILRRQTTTFAAYRQNVTGTQRIMAKLQVTKNLVAFTLVCFLYFLTTFGVKREIITKNSYSLNHIKFNQGYFTVLLKMYFA